MTIVIHKPLENIKIGDRNIRAVGIPDWRLRGEPSMVTVDIQYKYLRGKYRERQFPYPFQIPKAEVLKCNTRQLGKDTLYIVPVEIMTEVKPKSDLIIIKTEPRNLGDIPTKPCWNCQGTKFWKTQWGEFMCCRCHGNPDPTVNKEEVDIVERS